MLWLILAIVNAVGYAICGFCDNYITDVIFKGKKQEYIKLFYGITYLITGAALFLIFGIDEKDINDFYDYVGGTVADFRRNWRKDGSFFLQAHPFRSGMVLVGIETNHDASKHPVTAVQLQRLRSSSMSIASPETMLG